MNRMNIAIYGYDKDLRNQCALILAKEYNMQTVVIIDAGAFIYSGEYKEEYPDLVLVIEDRTPIVDGRVKDDYAESVIQAAKECDIPHFCLMSLNRDTQEVANALIQMANYHFSI